MGLAALELGSDSEAKSSQCAAGTNEGNQQLLKQNNEQEQQPHKFPGRRARRKQTMMNASAGIGASSAVSNSKKGKGKKKRKKKHHRLSDAPLSVTQPAAMHIGAPSVFSAPNSPNRGGAGPFSLGQQQYQEQYPQQYEQHPYFNQQQQQEQAMHRSVGRGKKGKCGRTQTDSAWKEAVAKAEDLREWASRE